MKQLDGAPDRTLRPPWRVRTALLLSALLLLAVRMPGALGSAVSNTANAHVTTAGARLPTPEFIAALDAAAMDISHLPTSGDEGVKEGTCPATRSARTLVMLAMANVVALELTAPIFLESLSLIKHVDASGKERTLDQHMVIVVWSKLDLQMCQQLQEKEGLKHQCVRDDEHKVTEHTLSFHSAGFNALGFAKVKYILNGLAAGHDVVFLDSDIVVLKNPVPYFLSKGADVFGAMEKCVVVDDTFGYQVLKSNKIPPFNIGVLYFRAAASVTRCVYNWFHDMYMEAQVRPRVWDQDLFGKVMVKCTAMHNVSWHALDPRLFQSACYPKCGCAFFNGEVKTKFGKYTRGQKYLNGTTACGPEHWARWVLMHFPCSGVAESKVTRMRALLEGVRSGKPAVINPPKAT